VVEEPGRRIVEAQLADGGRATPWQDREEFRDLLFARSLAAFEHVADRPGPVFFDRSIVEALAYSCQLGLPVPAAWQAAVDRCRYARMVFILPSWRAIFRTDTARRKSWDEVMLDYRCTIDTYRRAGYDLIEVPRAPVAERTAFVLRHARIDCANLRPDR
jgi:predicted ATPase